MTTLYRADAPGDWGTMTAPAQGAIGTGRLTAPGQPDIFYRYWRTPGATATLLLMHGLGAHSGWFIDMGNALVSRGLNVYAMDHRGFGRSGGPRGDTEHWQPFVADVDRVVEQIGTDLPATRRFVLGHSMGGIFATYYAAGAGATKLGGVVLLNPWIADTTKTPPGTLISGLIGGITNSAQIAHLPNERNSDNMTTNPEAERFLQADPLWVSQRTKRFYWQVAFLMRGGVLKQAAKVTIPALVIQGEADKVVVHAATRQAFAAMPSQDKTMLNVPGYDHDCEFQTDRSRLDDELTTWVKAHA